MRSSIHGRTHASLTLPVVRTVCVRKTVAWVSPLESGTLVIVPGQKIQKATGRTTPLGEPPA
jgi:hypothetical protein